MPRSRYRASCLRRTRFSARIAPDERTNNASDSAGPRRHRRLLAPIAACAHHARVGSRLQSSGTDVPAARIIADHNELTLRPRVFCGSEGHHAANHLMEATFVCSILLLCFFDATAALCTGRSPISPVQLLSAVTERAAFSRRGDVALLAQYI